METTLFWFANGVEIYQFNMKDSETKIYQLCFVNTVGNVKNKWFHGQMYGFSFIYDIIDISDIANIHKYLMKERCKMMFGFIFHE